MEVAELLHWSWKPLTSLEMTAQFWCHLSHVPLRAEPSDRAECVNEVLAGEKVEILQEGKGHWVQVALPDGYMGWMDDRQMRPVTKEWMGQTLCLSALSSSWSGVAGGTLPAGAVVRLDQGKWMLGEDEVAPMSETPMAWSGNMWQWAEAMKGVPYHWGGRSGWGMDCSGLVQLAARLCGIEVPRDASQQVKSGAHVQPQEVAINDVAFFENAEGSITHVGLCDGQGHILHASGEVRQDRLVDGHILRQEDDKPSHKLACIRRWGH